MKYYFTNISNTWYLMSDDCTKYEWNQPIIFWDITTNTQMYEKVPIITQISQAQMPQSQMLLYKHKQCMVPDNCTKYEQNHLWDITTLNLWKNVHSYSNLAQSQMLFYIHQWSMVPDHGTHTTQYEDNQSIHHGEMHGDDRDPDIQTDGQTLSYIPWFRFARSGE